MYGDNPLRHYDAGDGMSLDIVSVFNTIQGEGPFAGTPATFIRLFGCNLRCYFCDTDFETGRAPFKIDTLVNRPENHKLIVLTGGEPFRQPIGRLIAGLLRRNDGTIVQIETAGTLWFSQEDIANYRLVSYLLRQSLQIVVSPKTPQVRPEISDHATAWKYLVSNVWAIAEDGLPVCNTQYTNTYGDDDSFVPRKHRLARPPIGTSPHNIYLQPVDERVGGYAANMMLCAQLAMQHGYRLSIQQHKILGVP